MRSRRLSLALAAALVAALAPPASASGAPGLEAWSRGWRARPATFGVHETEDVFIEMRDGVRLVADVLRPAGDDGEPAPGRFPVIVTQTGYNQNSIPQLAFRSDYLVSRGYVQVIVDSRGTGGSEGVWDSFGPAEQADGKEVVEWAAAAERGWSNGRVGLHGASYGGINQIFTAAQRPKGLRAIFPVVPMADAYRDITFSGGQVNTSFIPAWLGLVTATSLLPPTYTAQNPAQAAGVVASHGAGALNFQAGTTLRSTLGDDIRYDGRFWRQRSPIEVIDRVQVPTFLVGGWYDLFQRGTPLLYERIARRLPSRLVMGPWYHLGGSSGEGLAEAGVPALEELELRWFDHYVRDVADPGLARTPAVTYAELGSGTFRTAASWPPPGVRPTPAYITGGATPGSPGTLGPAGLAAGGTSTMPWHPASGACTRGTTQWSAGIATGPCETDNRFNDQTGLSFDLPLVRDLVLSGPVSARLFVGTSGRDAFLTVRLEDVSPDGSASQITAGWNVLSLRAIDRSRSKPLGGWLLRPFHPYTKRSVLPVEADTVYEVWVEVFGTAARLPAGHTLRVSVQPSDAPHLTAPTPQAADLAGGVLTLYHGPEHPSAVVLPIGTS